MYISKLPTTESHWECGQFICIKSIRIVTARSRFEDSLRNIHFMDSTKDDKKVTKVTKSHPLVSVILSQMMILKSLTSIWWNLKVDEVLNNMSKISQSNVIW